MWRYAAIFAMGCGDGGTGGGLGTVAYVDLAGSVRLLDVTTRADTLVEDGSFGSVALASDGDRVAYVAEGNVVRVAGRDMPPASLSPTSGQCTPTPVWTGDALVWCVEGATGAESGFLPAGGVGRRIAAGSLAVSSDGARVAYRLGTAPLGGDLVIEDASGENRRTLVAGTTMSPIAFAPDGDRIVTYDGERLRAVALADGAVTDLAIGALPRPMWGEIANNSVFSPDGAEVLAVVDGQLSTVDVRTAARRPLVAIPPRSTVEAAAFLDASRVVYERFDDLSVDDIGRFLESVRLASATDPELVLQEAGHENGPCRPVALDRVDGVVAIDCAERGVAVTAAGKVLTSADGVETIGMDRTHGLVAIDAQGTITRHPAGGDAIVLGTARAAPQPVAIGPFAAYAP